MNSGYPSYLGKSEGVSVEHCRATLVLLSDRFNVCNCKIMCVYIYMKNPSRILLPCSTLGWNLGIVINNAKTHGLDSSKRSKWYNQNYSGMETSLSPLMHIWICILNAVSEAALFTSSKIHKTIGKDLERWSRVWNAMDGYFLSSACLRQLFATLK